MKRKGHRIREAKRNDMKSFGPRLRALRESRGLSQNELAELLQIDAMQVSRYERGLTLPSIEKAFRLARYLQVSVDELLSGQSRNLEPEIRDIRLLQRFRAIDCFPKDERETAFQLLDALIAKHRMEHLTDDIEGERPARMKQPA